MVMFNSYVKLSEGTVCNFCLVWFELGFKDVYLRNQSKTKKQSRHGSSIFQSFCQVAMTDDYNFNRQISEEVRPNCTDSHTPAPCGLQNRRPKGHLNQTEGELGLLLGHPFKNRKPNMKIHGFWTVSNMKIHGFKNPVQGWGQNQFSQGWDRSPWGPSLLGKKTGPGLGATITRLVVLPVKSPYGWSKFCSTPMTNKNIIIDI